METFKLTLAYDGSRYDGWQKQGNTGATIQGKLEGVLSLLAGAPVEVQGAGRTDAGVHARGQTASFRMETDLSPVQILAYLNRYLPEDIAVLDCQAAPPRFHARLSALGKVYRYQLRLGPVPDVFRRKYQYRVEEPLDLAAMERAAALLAGTHDFRSFCANRRFKKSSVRTLTALDIRRAGDEVQLVFEGDGFLYNMVRILTGTLVEVGMGLRRAQDIPAILDARDREAAGRTMPAQGLMLDEVFYPSQEEENP